MSGAKDRGTKTAALPDDVDIEIADIGETRLAILSWPTRGPAEESVRVTLSPTEEIVLRGIAMGMSNAQIANERGTSTRTVANQVASLLKKFGVASRYELVVAMTTKGTRGHGGAKSSS